MLNVWWSCAALFKTDALEWVKNFIQGGAYTFHSDIDAKVGEENMVPVPFPDRGASASYVTGPEFPVLCLALGYGHGDLTRTPKQK